MNSLCKKVFLSAVFYCCAMLLHGQWIKFTNPVGPICMGQNTTIYFTDTLIWSSSSVTVYVSNSSGGFTAGGTLVGSSTTNDDSIVVMIPTSFTSTPNYRLRIVSAGFADTSYYFKLNPLPIGNITSNNNNACSGAPLTFSATASGGTPPISYDWQFFGTNPPPRGTSQNSVVMFNNVGTGTNTYNVLLTVTDINGCSYSVVQSQTIRQQPYVALLDSNPSAIPPFTSCSLGPQANGWYTLTVQNNSTAGMANWNIQWGDGLNNTFSGAIPYARHTYTQQGLYHLTLTGTNTNGCSNSRNYIVSHQTTPTINAAFIGGTPQGCAPKQVKFRVTNYNTNSKGTYYKIDFGDGTPVLQLDSFTKDTVTYTYTTSSCLGTQTAFSARFSAHNQCDSVFVPLSNIQIWTKPTAQFNISPDTVLCLGDSVLFTNISIPGKYGSTCSQATTYNWTFAGTSITNFSGTAPPKLLFNTSGNFPVKLVATNACGSDSVTRYICVQPQPQNTYSITITPGTRCATSVVTVSNSSSLVSFCNNVTYKWQLMRNSVSVTNGYSFLGGTDSNSYNPVYSISQKGQYTLRFIVSSKCGAMNFKDTSFTIKDRPVVTFPVDAMYCDSVAIPFAPTSVAHFPSIDSSYGTLSNAFWNITPPGFSIITINPLAPVVAFPNTTVNPITYKVILAAMNECGLSLPDTQNITINPRPKITIGVNKTLLCASDTLNVSLTPFFSRVKYTWTATASSPLVSGHSNSTGYVRPNVFTHYLLNNSLTQQTVTYVFNSIDTLTNCVGRADTLVVTLRPKIVAEAGPDVSYICHAGTTNISLSSNVTGSQFTWTSSVVSGTGNGNSNQSTPTNGPIAQTLYNALNTPATFKYVIRAVNTACPSLLDTTVYVVVNPIPTVSNTVTTQTICSEDTARFTFVGTVSPTVFNYTASASGGSGSGYQNGSGAVLQKIYNYETDNIIVIYTVTPVGVAPSYCQGTPADFNVTVKPKPQLTVSPLNQNRCSNNSIDISISSDVSNSQFKWFATQVSGSSVSGFSDQSTYTTTNYIDHTLVNPGSGNAVISYKIVGEAKSCISDTVTASVTVYPLPVVNAGPDLTRCNNQGQFLLGGTPSGGTWMGIGVIGSLSFNPSLMSAGNYTLLYSYTNSNGCSNHDTMRITIVSNLQVNAGPDRNICINTQAPVQLSNFSPTGGTWTGTGVDSTGVFNHWTVGLGSYTLLYTYQGGMGCANNDTMIVYVRPKPGVGFSVSPQHCPNTYSAITVTVPSGTSISKYMWGAVNNLSLSNSIFSDSASGNPQLIMPENQGSSDANYNLNLITQSSYGCYDTTSGTTVLRRRPLAIFSHEANINCGPAGYTMNNTTSNISSAYLWSVSPTSNVNISNSNAQNPGITLPVNATTAAIPYTIMLVATRNDATLSCTDTFRSNVVVYNKPYVSFSYSPADSGCTPYSFSTGNTSHPLNSENPSTLNFDWKLFDGSLYSTPTISKTISNTSGKDSLYMVKLIAITQWGCRDSFSKPIKVFHDHVVAKFGTNTLQGCRPLNVLFTDSSTGTTQVRYFFGDGGNAASRNASHLYPTAGNFKAYQIVNNQCAFDTTIVDINVLPLPVATTSLPDTLCKFAAGTFTANLTNPNDTVTWYFGDGNSSGLSQPTHSYASVGKKIVTLQLKSAVNSCANIIADSIRVLDLPSVIITPDNVAACAYVPFSFTGSSNTGNRYEWDFGDTTFASGKIVQHLYNRGDVFDVKLKVTNVYGCFDSGYKQVTAHRVPVVSYVATPPDTCKGPVTVNFNNTSTDADTYSWDFGNSTSTTLKDPQVFYASVRSYTIRLIASNNNGCKDTLISSYHVYQPPKASFKLDLNNGCQPIQIQFTSTSSGAAKHNWYFGDGNSDTGKVVSHIYTADGKYPVSLQVTADNQCTDSVNLNDAVEVYPKPFSNFTYALDSFFMPWGLVHFTNQAQKANKFTWYYGDGNFSNEFNPSYRYKNSDTFRVQMVAFYGNLCSDTAYANIYIPVYEKGLFVPDAFVPNGINNVFRPVGTELRTYELRIYNRWGDLIWSTNELNKDGEPVQGWNGRDADGNPCMPGVYTWEIDASYTDGNKWPGIEAGNGKRYTRGVFTLLR